MNSPNKSINKFKGRSANGKEESKEGSEEKISSIGWGGFDEVFRMGG
jgi:hypothetical protein